MSSSGHDTPAPTRASTWLIAAALAAGLLVATAWGPGRGDAATEATPSPGIATEAVPEPSQGPDAPAYPAPEPPEGAEWIDYVSSEGQGRLIIEEIASDGPTTTLQVSVTATSGDQTFWFSSFSAAGQEVRPLAQPHSTVSRGTISEGETVEGTLEFPTYQDFTLVMGNNQQESITALMITV